MKENIKAVYYRNGVQLSKSFKTYREAKEFLDTMADQGELMPLFISEILWENDLSEIFGNKL